MNVPRPISSAEQAARQRRVVRIARPLDFVGRVEYRHARSTSGGAQFALAAKHDEDVLIVYAEAFERDAKPDDYSLESIIAHERGHQMLARNPRLLRNLPRNWSAVTEEIAASLLGSLLPISANDKQNLLMKAMFDATEQGMEPDRAMALIRTLHSLLEELQ